MPTAEGSRRFFAAVAALRPERHQLREIIQEVAPHTARLTESSGRRRKP
jgi:hypothetical protein